MRVGGLGSCSRQCGARGGRKCGAAPGAARRIPRTPARRDACCARESGCAFAAFAFGPRVRRCPCRGWSSQRKGEHAETRAHQPPRVGMSGGGLACGSRCPCALRSGKQVCLHLLSPSVSPVSRALSRPHPSSLFAEYSSSSARRKCRPRASWLVVCSHDRQRILEFRRSPILFAMKFTTRLNWDVTGSFTRVVIFIEKSYFPEIRFIFSRPDEIHLLDRSAAACCGISVFIFGV